jgi:hypothetical protein
VTRRRLTLSHTGPGLALAAALAGVTACSDSPVVPKSAPRPEAVASSSLAPKAAAAALPCAPREAQSTSAVIGPDGGTLEVGGHRLIVPAGALAKPTLITGTVPADTTATIVFAPAGLKFKVPATLVMSVLRCESTVTDPHIRYIDKEGRSLEQLPALYDRKRREVTAPLFHFSGYQVWV